MEEDAKKTLLDKFVQVCLASGPASPAKPSAPPASAPTRLLLRDVLVALHKIADEHGDDLPLVHWDEEDGCCYDDVSFNLGVQTMFVADGPVQIRGMQLNHPYYTAYEINNIQPDREGAKPILAQVQVLNLNHWEPTIVLPVKP